MKTLVRNRHVDLIIMAAEMRGAVREMNIYARNPRNPRDKREIARRTAKEASAIARDCEKLLK